MTLRMKILLVLACLSLPSLGIAETYPVFAFWNQDKIVITATNLDGSLIKTIDSQLIAS